MKGTGRSQTGSRVRRAGARPALFAALLAVLLQAFVVQTHVHAFGPPAATQQSAAAGAADTAHVAAAHDQGACVFCETLAGSGRATLTQSAVAITADRAVHDGAARVVQPAARAVSHAWRSRAPPIRL